MLLPLSSPKTLSDSRTAFFETGTHLVNLN
jgi:hypothetical protein